MAKKDTTAFLMSLAVLFLCPVGAFAMEGVAGAKAATSSPGAESPNDRYRFDRRIERADGSIERVQVGGDMFFRLDGRKVRLVGMDIGTTGLSNGYFKADSLANPDFKIGGAALLRIAPEIRRLQAPIGE